MYVPFRRADLSIFYSDGSLVVVFNSIGVLVETGTVAFPICVLKGSNKLLNPLFRIFT